MSRVRVRTVSIRETDTKTEKDRRISMAEDAKPRVPNRRDDVVIFITAAVTVFSTRAKTVDALVTTDVKRSCRGRHFTRADTTIGRAAERAPTRDRGPRIKPRGRGRR